MNYFGRLIEQTGLTIGNGAGPEPTQPRFGIGLPPDAGPGATQEPTDILEVDQVVDAQPLVDRRPLPPGPADPVAATPSPKSEGVAEIGTARDPPPPVQDTAAERPGPAPSAVPPPPAPAARPDRGPAERDQVTSQPQLKEVLRWVAAAPEPVRDADHPERSLDLTLGPGREPPTSPPAAVTVRRVPTPDRNSTAHPPPARIEDLQRDLVSSARADDVLPLLSEAPARTAVPQPMSPLPRPAPAEEAVEEVVQVSIGSIHVRVEAPAPKAPAAAIPAPGRPPAEPGRPTERRGMDPRRRYLHS